MVRRDPGRARFLGLWTAGWLAVFLAAGLVWLGNLALQWPVLLIPVLWAAVAARPRRGRRRDGPRGWEVLPAPVRTDTVERPIVNDPEGRVRRRR